MTLNANAGMPKRKITILGATGSIGDSTIDIVLSHPELYEVVALTGGRNVKRLVEIAKKIKPAFVALADENGLDELKQGLSGLGIELAAGNDAVLKAASLSCDMTISAIVGFAGLAPTLAALDACSILALANKESLVCAGTLVRNKAEANNVTLLPMDSEHNAIYQALNGEEIGHVEKVVLTASGGPFRTWTKEKIATAGPQDALNHPNWSMGAKITIDSATLMNKGLEVIEAHHLFPVEHEQLDVVVHPQSIIHGMVTFVDGAVLAELGTPDMRTPIAHCMAHPERISTSVKPLNLAEIGELTFEKPDLVRFPMLKLALNALKEGDVATNLLNAANEMAVQGFLEKRLGFYEMSDLVARTLESGLTYFSALNGIQSFEEASQIDAFARKAALDFFKSAA